jgi:5-hydroxyisourate hydrolase
MGRLTTHVLNTAEGIPAAGMAVHLFRGDTRALILETRTNADGRCDAPLLEGAAFVTGKYILAFSAADYFRDRKLQLADPPFLDVIEIAFGIGGTGAHYHVPLLVSPWAYSTYRGS